MRPQAAFWPTGAWGGEEVKTTGDGLLAVFGSAVDALEAAVAAQQATDDQGRRVGHPLALRVGIAVGEVAFVEDGDVFGTPVVEAARLVAAAGQGQILCTALVRAMAGSRTAVAFGDAGELTLKGLPDPVATCEVAWTPQRPEAEPVPLPSLLTAGRIFVGRDEELDRLRRWWKDVGEGGCRLVLVGGEPGAGKTRLAVQLAGAVHEDGAVVLAGRCDEDLGVPYQPFVEALRHYVTSVAEPRLGRHAGDLVRLLPELGGLVAGLPEPLQADPETERYRLFDAVAAWLAEASAAAPVLLVLDDLQWAAKPTVLLLRHVARSGESLRLLVVATYRDTDIRRGDPLAELLADIPRLDGAQRLSIGGLDVPAVTAFVERAAGHELDDEGRELARVVWQETEGNAFFVAEVLRHLLEAGALEQVDGRWVVRGVPGALGIPDGVRAVVRRRLSRLSDDTNRVLAGAAVAGLEFDLAVVAAAGPFDEDTVVSAVEEAVAARLVVEVTGGAPPRARFAHSLVRATLYDELSAARRVTWHRKVAEAIEGLFAGRLDDHLPALAQHWALAPPPAEPTRAVGYARRAGGRALAQLAHDEAADWYRQAIDLLDAAGTPADEHTRMELLIALGEAQRRAGDPAHRETLLAAASLARRLGDADALARAALANYRGLFSIFGGIDVPRLEVIEAALSALPDCDSAVRAQLLGILAVEQTYAVDPAASLAISEEALSMARRLDQPGPLAVALLSRLLAFSGPAYPRERLALTDEVLALGERPRDPRIRFYANWSRYIAASQLGELETADTALEQSERLAAELAQPNLRWWATMHRANRELIAGRMEHCEAFATRAREIGLAAGEPEAELFFLGIMFYVRFDQARLGEIAEKTVHSLDAVADLVLAQSWKGMLYYEIGRRTEAQRIVERAVGELDGFRREMQWLRCAAQLAYLCARLDDAARAATLTTLIAPYTGQFVANGVSWLGAVDHHLASLAAVLGRFDEADGLFAAAEAQHQRIGASPWVARTRLEWARLLLRRGGPGDAEGARGLIDHARATAVGLGLGGIERDVAELTADR